MGGSGSGRWRAHIKKGLVEDCFVLDIQELMRHGLFTRGSGQLKCPWGDNRPRWGGNQAPGLTVSYKLEQLSVAERRVKVTYTVVESGKRIDRVEDVPITTARRLKAIRQLFTCPRMNDKSVCGRVIDKLYLPPNSRHFACRQCHHLSYRSCQTSHDLDYLVRGNMSLELKRRLIRMFRVKKRVAQLRRARWIGSSVVKT